MNPDNKTIFYHYLQQIRPLEADQRMPQFQSYLDILLEINQGINLISRKTPAELYWTQHFLDSISLLECLDLAGKKVLDFGSGGGLPGIPLKLLEPSCSIVLLDSVAKKVNALKQMIQHLELTDISAVWSRLEDYAVLKDRPAFDLIVCRAVALEDRYLGPLRLLLAPGGKLAIYKSHDISDLDGIKTELLMQKEDEILGLRRFYAIERKDLIRQS